MGTAPFPVVPLPPRLPCSERERERVFGYVAWNRMKDHVVRIQALFIVLPHCIQRLTGKTLLPSLAANVSRVRILEIVSEKTLKLLTEIVDRSGGVGMDCRKLRKREKV
jgi:hypothetical protein